MLRQRRIFACLPNDKGNDHCNQQGKNGRISEPECTHLRTRLRASIFLSTESYILSASSSSCSYVVPAKRPYSLSGSWNCSGSTSGSSPRLACASLRTQDLESGMVRVKGHARDNLS